MVYASQVLSAVETRYAQIEKEHIAVVFVCDHFNAYIYGQSRVNIETDHRPLESIVQRLLHSGSDNITY